jgi:8-oxo-dGTP diphosphatase
MGAATPKSEISYRRSTLKLRLGPAENNMAQVDAPTLVLPDDIQVVAVGALLFTPSGKYLMQKRDDRAGVRMRGNWGIFGGAVEANESLPDSLVRELEEELAFKPQQFAWFTEILYCLHQVGRKYHRKHFFEVPIREEQIQEFVLGEGEQMRLFEPAELLSSPQIVPWDSYGVLLHSHRKAVFDKYWG